jgi:hypothetical protein
VSIATTGPEPTRVADAPEDAAGASAAGLASGLYVGAVRHRRFEVREHVLRYRLALVYLDLDELPRLLGGRLVDTRHGLVRFRRRDYLGDPATPLSAAVRDEVERQSGQRSEGPIRLLTQLRSYGHCFNPVSFYYCFDHDGQRLEHVLAEVTNTPWGERHPYVISASDAGSRRAPGAPLTGESQKRLHVSPFMGMDYTYQWQVTAPGRQLLVNIENHRGGNRTFDATLSMRRHELTDAALTRMARRYPFATLRVLALIYAHAVRLGLKGVPLHSHPSTEVS